MFLGVECFGKKVVITNLTFALYWYSSNVLLFFFYWEHYYLLICLVKHQKVRQMQQEAGEVSFARLLDTIPH